MQLNGLDGGADVDNVEDLLRLRLGFLPREVMWFGAGVVLVLLLL